MKKLSLNRNQLKYLVIIAMLIDHIAWAPGCRSVCLSTRHC